MQSFRMQDVPGQQFRFPEQRVTSPAVPTLPAMQGASPTALGIPAAALNSHTHHPNLAPQPAMVPRGQTREGRCHRNRAQDPGQRSPGEAGKEGSQDRGAPRIPPGHPPPGMLRPASSTPPVPRLPVRLHKTPTFRHVGPALPAVSREVREERGHQVSRDLVGARQREEMRVGKRRE